MRVIIIVSLFFIGVCSYGQQQYFYTSYFNHKSTHLSKIAQKKDMLQELPVIVEVFEGTTQPIQFKSDNYYIDDRIATIKFKVNPNRFLPNTVSADYRLRNAIKTITFYNNNPWEYEPSPALSEQLIVVNSCNAFGLLPPNW